jgi:hypothetical protein
VSSFIISASHHTPRSVTAGGSFLESKAGRSVMTTDLKNAVALGPPASHDGKPPWPLRRGGEEQVSHVQEVVTSSQW